MRAFRDAPTLSEGEQLFSPEQAGDDMTHVARLELRPVGRDAPADDTSLADQDRTGADLIARPRLLEALSEATEGVLTLLTAPVGCGKTTLIDAWLVACDAPGPVVRMVAAESDVEPEFFWRHLLAALERDVPSLRLCAL